MAFSSGAIPRLRILRSCWRFLEDFAEFLRTLVSTTRTRYSFKKLFSGIRFAPDIGQSQYCAKLSRATQQPPELYRQYCLYPGAERTLRVVSNTALQNQRVRGRNSYWHVEVQRRTHNQSGIVDLITERVHAH